jgi:Ca2+-binding EF-hand superfamily protein
LRFKKFDSDNSGELEMREFHAAWKLLGLKGTPAEMDRSFYNVDANNSGRIDMDEFKDSIKSSRSAELSMNLIFETMDGQLEGKQTNFGK